MPVHYATQAWTTGCGVDLEQIGESERVTEDLALVDCDSCLEDVERSRAWHAMSQEPAYQAGYEDGKSKAFFELSNWLPQMHGVGCGCDPCLTGGVVARRLAEVWVAEAVQAAADGKLTDERTQQLQESIAESAGVRELLEVGAWARAITEGYAQARVAVLAEWSE